MTQPVAIHMFIFQNTSLLSVATQVDCILGRSYSTSLAYYIVTSFHFHFSPLNFWPIMFSEGGTTSFGESPSARAQLPSLPAHARCSPSPPKEFFKTFYWQAARWPLVEVERGRCSAFFTIMPHSEESKHVLPMYRVVHSAWQYQGAAESQGSCGCDLVLSEVNFSCECCVLSVVIICRSIVVPHKSTLGFFRGYHRFPCHVS